MLFLAYESTRASDRNGDVSLELLVLLFGLLLILRILATKNWTDRIRYEFKTEVDEEGTESREDGPQPLNTSQTLIVAVHHSSRELDKDNLKATDSEPNGNEVEVLKDMSKHIELVIDLSAANHVEDLEPYKQVEYGSEMSRL